MQEEAVIVFDFETTGSSPKMGDRPIEVGAVRIENRMIVDTFQSLMNPGFTITSFIESITGIGNDMLLNAPPCEEVMEQFAAFIGTTPLVAHNASFDRQFLDSELEQLNLYPENAMACSMLISRRIFPNAPNHKLRTLIEYCGLANNDVFHRALEDAEKTGHLWITMCDTIYETYGLEKISFPLMQQLEKIKKVKVEAFFERKVVEQKNSMLHLWS
ncbi:3'-5' exonuclease [Desulfogranum marinum]|uniref:3'-5' exonuclease n=1 Tax=Desulfogranum marinum TaxID=453220 RepID=UPI0029C7619D|nr:3'-5' exonuclease [Desulfogranum marinum]